MSVTTEPEFYNSAMTDEDELAMLPLEQSPWLPLYQQVSYLVAGHPVFDLGCGTGRFAEQLRSHGHEDYRGVDFSPAAIKECRAYVPEWKRRFRVVDLREWSASRTRAHDTIYVCLETLEHLEDDIDLVRRIPVGHRFIYSLPNFLDVAHLRAFENASDAWRRYGHLLDFQAWMLLGGRIHLYCCQRRADSW